MDLSNFLRNSFLQTPEWEQFQQARGKTTYRLNETLFIKHAMRFGQSYWYAPRAFSIPTLEQLDATFKDKTTFIKIEPQQGKLKKPFIPMPSVQPRQTVLLDLTKSEDKLLEDMKGKTRYNVRLAERKKIQIARYDYPDSLERLEEFIALTKETNLRDQIRSYDDHYYLKLLEVLGKAGKASLLVAYYEDKPLASMILIRHEGVATYLFGASSSKNQNLMASYLLQWHAILFAKASGDKIYDMWGVRVDERVAPGEHAQTMPAEKMQPRPGKTYGVSRFKLGFNGEIYIYHPAYDRSYKQFWYNLYKGYRGINSRKGFSY